MEPITINTGNDVLLPTEKVADVLRIEIDKNDRFQIELNKWKEVADSLYNAWIYLRTYGNYPVADNAIEQYEKAIQYGKE